MFPENYDYRLYYAQSLYKAGQYSSAQKACAAIDNPAMAAQVCILLNARTCIGKLSFL